MASESEIIQRVIDGDVNAFEELVLANQKNVYNLALKMTRNEEDALDISQEVFIRVYQRLATFRKESRFSVWIYRIAYNLAVDFLRAKKQDSVMFSLNQERDNDDFSPLEIPDLRNLPEDTAIRSETRKAIAAGIDELPEKYRQVLVLREISGMTYDEMSQLFHVSMGTIKSRLARARLKLAKILEENGTIPDAFRLND